MDSRSALDSLCQGMDENTARCLNEGRCPRCGHDREQHQHPDWTDDYTSGLLYTDCDECRICKPQLRLQEAAERERKALAELHDARRNAQRVLTELAARLSG